MLTIYISRNDYNYRVHLTHPVWGRYFGGAKKWKQTGYLSVSLCSLAGNKLLKGLGLEPLRSHVSEDHKTLVEVKLNPRTKTWEVTEWVPC